MIEKAHAAGTLPKGAILVLVDKLDVQVLAVFHASFAAICSLFGFFPAVSFAWEEQKDLHYTV
ncbi:MAG: hypothetical protein ACREV4_08370 [Gammaproteobacteria bacterium]